MWDVGRRLNLERALRVGDELGGHIVTGHVDAVGRIVAIEPVGDSVKITVEAPAPLAPHIAPKGPITLDGVSSSAERRVGKEGDRTCRSRWPPEQLKKNTTKKKK